MNEKDGKISISRINFHDMFAFPDEMGVFREKEMKLASATGISIFLDSL